MIDVENSIKAQESEGYKNWAVKHNLKQASETLLFLQENDLENLDKLNNFVEGSENRITDIQSEISSVDSRLKEIASLQKHLSAYNKTRNVFEQYQRSKQSPDFYRKHKEAIDKCIKAKEHFDSLGLETLPKYKDLQAEYSALMGEKNKAYAERNSVKKELRDYINAKRNIDMILDNHPEPEANREERTRKERTRTR